MTRLKIYFKLFGIGIIYVLTSCLGLPDEEIDYTPEREAAIIIEYMNSLTVRGYDIDTSDVGIYYVILEEGEGEFAQPGDSIGLSYIGFFPESNSIFDASEYWYEDGIWKFTYLSTDLIPGLNNAINLLNKGAAGLFLIPSDLAYGSSGSDVIPPYSPIVFELKLVEIYE